MVLLTAGSLAYVMDSNGDRVVVSYALSKMLLTHHFHTNRGNALSIAIPSLCRLNQRKWLQSAEFTSMLGRKGNDPRHPVRQLLADSSSVQFGNPPASQGSVFVSRSTIVPREFDLNVMKILINVYVQCQT